jgi:hypothetical protein
MFSAMYANLLAKVGIKVLTADNLVDAEFLFNGHRESLRLVSVDGDCLGVDMTVFVQKMRNSGFNGPKDYIVANTDNVAYRDILMRVGCSHYCDKSNVLTLIKRLVDFAPS